MNFECMRRGRRGLPKQRLVGALRVLTCGSVLALTMGTHVNLVEDYYAPGSIGQFSIQFTVEVDNYSRDVVTPELVVICMNSGSFATDVVHLALTPPF